MPRPTASVLVRVPVDLDGDNDPAQTKAARRLQSVLTLGLIRGAVPELSGYVADLDESTGTIYLRRP